MSWIPHSINYQINLRALSTREPRNPIEAATEQDLKTSPLSYLIRNLDVIKILGVTVLHLMPPFPIGKKQRKGIGSPYAIRNYQDIEEELGTLNEMKAFVRAAHQLEFKVILGMVPNHTSRDHVWTISNPEYYRRSTDGSPAYDFDWSDTSKLDYSQAGLRKAMIETFDFWLSLLEPNEDGTSDGVDGFRMDMAHLINDLSFWNEAIKELKRRHPKRQFLFLAECYGMDNNLDLFDRGFNAAYDDDFYKVCASFYGVDEAEQTCILPPSESPSSPNFIELLEAFQNQGIAGAMEKALMRYETHLSAGDDAPRLARYTDNHDEGRGVYRFGDGAVLAVNQLLFLSAHTIPFLFAGQEFGASNRPAIHQRMGTCNKTRRIRKGESIVEEPGIEFEGNLFARGHRRRKGWYAFYRELVALRLQCPELLHGDFNLIEPGEKCSQNQRTVIAFQRRYQDSVLRCAVNLGPEPRKLSHAKLFHREPIYGGLENGVMAPFTSIVVRTSI